AQEGALRRQKREESKFGKQLAAEKQQERHKAKQAELNAIKKWRQLHKKSDAGQDSDFPPELLDPSSALRKQLDATGELASANRRQEKSKEREEAHGGRKLSNTQRKAQKYGFGGKKGKHHKNPDAKSTENWERDWSTKRNKQLAPE